MATLLMEQYHFANDVVGILQQRVWKLFTRNQGNYMTSIDMAGISLTFIKLEHKEWVDALNSPVTTIAWQEV